MIASAYTEGNAYKDYKYMLNIVDNAVIHEFYRRYRINHKISYAPSDPERWDFEAKFILYINEIYKQIYGYEFVYPGTASERQRFQDIVNSIDIKL